MTRMPVPSVAPTLIMVSCQRPRLRRSEGPWVALPASSSIRPSGLRRISCRARPGRLRVAVSGVIVDFQSCGAGSAGGLRCRRLAAGKSTASTMACERAYMTGRNILGFSVMGLSAHRDTGAGELGQVLLGDFLDALPGELPVLVGGAAPAAAGGPVVRWVEPSELEDPTPYLLDGELILTAGLPFTGAGGTAEALDGYVARLVQANVCALGFGVEPYFDEVPPGLVQACRRHGLMLLRIPQTVPFAALGLHFARLLEAQNLRALRRISEATRQLLKAALSGRPDAQVLDTLARHVPVRVLLAGADGRIRLRSAAGHRPDAGRLAALLGRLFAGSGPRIEVDSFDEPGYRSVTGYPLRSTRDATLGAVVIGAEAALGPVERNIVEVAVGLLEAQVRQRTSGALAPGQLATGLLLHPETVLAGAPGQPGAARDLLAQCTSSPRPNPLRVVQGIRAGGQDGALPAGESPLR